MQKKVPPTTAFNGQVEPLFGGHEAARGSHIVLTMRSSSCTGQVDHAYAGQCDYRVTDERPCNASGGTADDPCIVFAAGRKTPEIEVGTLRMHTSWFA